MYTDDLQYHIHLVDLLSMCTEGKNVTTEMKCHSLLPLDEIVRVVTHPDCIPQVRHQQHTTLLVQTSCVSPEKCVNEVLSEIFIAVHMKLNLPLGSQHAVYVHHT